MVGKDKNFGNKTKVSHSNLTFFFLILFLVISAGCIYNFLLLPNIRLKGSRHIEIDYLSEYKEPGYSAYFLHDDITNQVKVTNNINSKKLGDYKVIYSVDIDGFKRKVVRNVRVTDKTGPVIELTNGTDVHVCPGRKYVEEGYKAFDSYDGDVTDKVQVVTTRDKISYSVRDKHGNTTSIKRNIIYEDKEKPEITLNGDNIVYMFVGDTYQDSFVNVVDNCDSNLQDSVKVSNNVNMSEAGSYHVTYTVKDSSGNENTITREVIVSEHGKNGTIYLTFDDGPKNGTTNVILDILKEEGVKATFFVTNSGPDELIKRAYDEGHTIALHTASHTYSIVYASVDSYFNDLNIVSERVKNITGVESKIIRFPGGSSNTVSRKYSSGIMSYLTSEVLKRGYRYYDWNVSSGDAAGGSPTASMIYDNVVSNLSKNRVNMVLMHDIKTYTRDALRDIIRYGKENGYVFDKITQDTEMITQRVNN